MNLSHQDEFTLMSMIRGHEQKIQMDSINHRSDIWVVGYFD
jgi:hypothetical protein